MWYHAACKGVSDEVYRILSKTEEIHWFCNEDVKERWQTAGQKIKNTIQEIDNSFRNAVDDTVKTEVRSHITDGLYELQRTMEESKQHMDKVRMARIEQQETEARWNNIILYRIP